MSSREHATGLLQRVSERSDSAADELLALVYGDLRRIAASYLKNERPDHTLQPTALIHELYLRLSRRRGIQARDRREFLGQATVMIRRLLVDHARRRNAAKRGGGLVAPNDDLGGASIPAPEPCVLALHQSLHRLRELDPDQARVVELRYFVGLSVDEIADALDKSPRTVARLWASARAWLYRELT